MESSDAKIKVVLTDGTELKITTTWWSPDLNNYNDDRQEFVQIGGNVIRKSSILRVEKTEE